MIVGLVSCYLEGPLVRGAIDSLRGACDRILVFEGPAGEPLEDPRIPESVLHRDSAWYTVRDGVWRTDAKKRTAMIEACRRFEPPVWGVWVDGDEVLCNGAYLRDWLRIFDWRDELAPEGEPPTLGWPVKLVELDGSVVVCRGKCVRVDLIDSYSVSSSVFRTVADVEHGEGNVPFDFRKWVADRAAGYAEGRLYLRPPLPCEPFLLHRSALRHPLRLGLRMHAQEAVELEMAKGAAS